jgi:tripartite ATP-independent transporter DctM subunit
VSVELASLLLFASMFTLLATGIPIAIALAGVAVVFCIAFWGFDRIYILASAGFSSLQNVNLVAIPLFILMGWIIYKSGVADDLFDTMHVWMGNVKGGLAMGTIVIGALFGAICASLVPALLTITTVALPALLKRGYDKRLALGCIMVSGLLSFLIPPSVVMIIFSSVTGLSIGRMYLGALVPGFLLASLYILYIGVRCRFQPELGPPAPSETRIGWGVRIAKLKGVAAPLVLLVSMLVGIYSGKHSLRQPELPVW